MNARRWCWLLFAAALSCGGPTQPEAFTHQPAWAPEALTVRPISVTDLYVRWWSEVEECTGRSRDMREIRFFEVFAPIEGTQFPCLNEERWCSGVYADSTVYLSHAHAWTERFAKHEMLHAIFRGGPSHESLLFLRCT